MGIDIGASAAGAVILDRDFHQVAMARFEHSAQQDEFIDAEPRGEFGLAGTRKRNHRS